MKLKYRPLTLQDLSALPWFPFVEPAIRIEESQHDDRYLVRAEIPGVDPTKDITITTQDSTLHLTVTRPEHSPDDSRTEFRYGTFHRTITLPPGTKQDTITATYTDGILQITMTITEPQPHGRTIPVTVTNTHPKPVKKN